MANGSYDVRLGEYYYRTNPDVKVLNPWNKDHIDKYWGGALTAEIADKNNGEKLGLEIGQKFIKIGPRELILAHTEEFIGAKII